MSPDSARSILRRRRHHREHNAPPHQPVGHYTPETPTSSCPPSSPSNVETLHPPPSPSPSHISTSPTLPSPHPSESGARTSTKGSSSTTKVSSKALATTDDSHPIQSVQNNAVVATQTSIPLDPLTPQPSNSVLNLDSGDADASSDLSPDALPSQGSSANSLESDPGSMTNVPQTPAPISASGVPPPSTGQTLPSGGHPPPNHAAPIIGGLIGGLVLVALVTIAAFFVRRSRLRGLREASSIEEFSTAGGTGTTARRSSQKVSPLSNDAQVEAVGTQPSTPLERNVSSASTLVSENDFRPLLSPHSNHSPTGLLISIPGTPSDEDRQHFFTGQHVSMSSPRFQDSASPRDTEEGATLGLIATRILELLEARGSRQLASRAPNSIRGSEDNSLILGINHLSLTRPGLVVGHEAAPPSYQE